MRRDADASDLKIVLAHIVLAHDVSRFSQKYL
jgi:hypothetical protein